VSGYRWQCANCVAVYKLDQVRYTCPRCPRGDGRLSLLIDYSRVPGKPPAGDEFSMWRYADLLPAGRLARPSLPVGWTPLYRPERLAERLGIAELYVKNETVNPTGSLKDRASALVTAAALEAGERVVVTASTGNAAAALAAMSAASGLRCVVVVPAVTPVAKLRQIAAYGAHLVRVDGDYDTAVDLSRAAAERWGWYCRNTAVNPYTAEGKKTAALEIAEQLGWQAPDTVVVPAGDGNILTGLSRGFADAYALGWIERLPRLIGVQSAAAPALWLAWRTGRDSTAEARSTADSINVGRPQDQTRAVAAVRATGGAFILVSDAELAKAAAVLARETGVLAEPASAAPLAALPRLLAERIVDPLGQVVLVCTGRGLKTVAGPAEAIPAVEPTLEAVSARLAANGWRVP
jgi:threonine synthase